MPRFNLSVITLCVLLSTAPVRANVDDFALPISVNNSPIEVRDLKPKNDNEHPIDNIINSLKSKIPEQHVLMADASEIQTLTPQNNVDYGSYGAPPSSQIQDLTLSAPNTSFKTQLKANYSPTPSFNMKPGENKAVIVAAGLMNRITTNFNMIAVRTSDMSAVIEAQDGYVYVTTNSSNPLGLMIYEEGLPETAISLVLKPEEALPVMLNVNVQLSWKQKQAINARTKERERMAKVELANQVDNSHASAEGHVERIKNILIPIAQQDIPRGFVEADEIPETLIRPCSIPIRQKVSQRFSGNREYIDVVVVYNHTNYPYQVKEEQCMSRDTLGVALLDQSIIQPGQSSEIYIVRDKLFKEKLENRNKRRRVSAAELGLTIKG